MPSNQTLRILSRTASVPAAISLKFVLPLLAISSVCICLRRSNRWIFLAALREAQLEPLRVGVAARRRWTETRGHLSGKRRISRNKRAWPYDLLLFDVIWSRSGTHREMPSVCSDYLTGVGVRGCSWFSVGPRGAGIRRLTGRQKIQGNDVLGFGCLLLLRLRYGSVDCT